MAFMTGAPLVPCFIERIGPGRFKACAGEPIVVRRDRPRDEAIQAAAQEFAESAGRARPRRIPSTGITSTATGMRSADTLRSAALSDDRMDPLTHIVVGRAVVAAFDGDGPAARGVAAAAILGALAPDIDIGVALSGWDRYLRVHEVGTHSLAGALATAGLMAAGVRFATRRGGLEPPRRPGIGTPYALLAATAAGAISHLGLDLVSGARIRVGWPFVQQRVSLPLVAMADPWLIGICVAGLLAFWPGGTRLRTVARAILVAATAFLAFKGALLHHALRMSPLATTAFPAVEAQWGSLTNWSIFEHTSTAVRAWAVNSRDRPAVVWLSESVSPDTPLVKASRSLGYLSTIFSVSTSSAFRSRAGAATAARRCCGQTSATAGEKATARPAAASGPAARSALTAGRSHRL